MLAVWAGFKFLGAYEFSQLRWWNQQTRCHEQGSQSHRQWCFAAFLQLKIFSLFRGRQVMADKEQAEENGRGGDVVDGNSQGGKKGKKGEFVLWNRLIPPAQIYLTKPTQEKVERVLKKMERRLSSSWALTSRKSWGRPWRCSACRTRSNKSGRWSIKSSQFPLQSAPKSEEDASKKNFQFWSTQPVSTCFSKFSRWIVFLGLTYGMLDHKTSQVVDMLICARCQPWRRWSPRTSASARMSQQRRLETFSSCETRK